ncbi:hypothetical protein C8J57DRAFT_990573, partial [Mycena rebaudengoi]
DIILTSEPWWGDIGNETQGPVAHQAWTPILPVGSVRKGQRPRVMAYVKQRRDFTVTLRSDIARDLDIQVLDVEQSPHPTTTIVNVYSCPRGRASRRRSDAAKRLQRLRLPTDNPVIISGDINKYHTMWGIGDR